MDDKLGYEIGELLVKFYGNERGFIRAYNANMKKVLYKIITNLKVVPIDIVARLDKTYLTLTTSKPDNYTAA